MSNDSNSPTSPNPFNAAAPMIPWSTVASKLTPAQLEQQYPGISNPNGYLKYVKTDRTGRAMIAPPIMPDTAGGTAPPARKPSNRPPVDRADHALNNLVKMIAFARAKLPGGAADTAAELPDLASRIK